MTGEQDTVNPAQLSLTEWLPLAERAKLGCLPDALHIEQIATLEYPDNPTMRVAYAHHLQAECDADKLQWFESQYGDAWIEEPEGLTWRYKRLELCEGPTPTIRRADYRAWLIRQGKSPPAWWFPTKAQSKEGVTTTFDIAEYEETAVVPQLTDTDQIEREMLANAGKKYAELQHAERNKLYEAVDSTHL